jgi:hypothetical protein
MELRRVAVVELRQLVPLGLGGAMHPNPTRRPRAQHQNECEVAPMACSQGMTAKLDLPSLLSSTLDHRASIGQRQQESMCPAYSVAGWPPSALSTTFSPVA